MATIRYIGCPTSDASRAISISVKESRVRHNKGYRNNSSDNLMMIDLKDSKAFSYHSGLVAAGDSRFMLVTEQQFAQALFGRDTIIV